MADAEKRKNGGEEEKEEPESADKKEQTKKKKAKKEEEELSPEDQEMMENLKMLVERIQEDEPELQKASIRALSEMIRTSTSSMTSVPLPLKFLAPYYTGLRSFVLANTGPNVKELSDLISVMAMTMSEETSRDSLHFKLKGTLEEIGLWGHEYLRHLAREITEEFNAREEESCDDLMTLVEQIVPFNMTHHAEHEACDLLMEVKRLPMILDLVDETNYRRVCLYLLSCAQYDPDIDAEIYDAVLKMYMKMKQYPDAMAVAVRINSMEEIRAVLEACEDHSVKKQLCFLLGRHHLFEVETEDEELDEIISQGRLAEDFKNLGRSLDVAEPKTPEDIYKSHLVESRFNSAGDTVRKNLADTFVNAFVNAGFGQDKLVSTDGQKWIFRNKENAMISATASLGVIHRWDVLDGINKLDKYTHMQDEFVNAGALLGVGLLNSGVKNECDPALALLSEFVAPEQTLQKRISAILGLGFAYVGTPREDLRDVLLGLLESDPIPPEILGYTCLALGMIYTGTADGTVSFSVIDCLMRSSDETLKSSFARFACLGLGLLYLGTQEQVEVAVETILTLNPIIAKYGALTLETCAYAATGNVLKVQEMLHACTDHIEKEEESLHQAVAVIGIALISMGEEIGSDMSLRTFDHLLQYGEPVIRRSVPLALGMHSASNPRLDVMDTLSKLSHDHDIAVARNAILALGMIVAGTNNSRAAQLLRDLFVYYYKDAATVFIVRIAQGLLHMGKGTMTISPLHTDRTLVDRVAMCGLITVLHTSFELEKLVLGSSHYLLYNFVLAMHPRMLMTFDEDLNEIQVDVRVGQALDTVGQAGHPKTITGHQTHTTPVLLLHGERAELGTDEYIALTKCLEGHVILRKNPDFVPASST